MDRQVKVLITDAAYTHTLGAVRSLGRAGFHVTAVSPDHRAVSFYSRYCHDRVLCPDPDDEEQFIDFIGNYIQENPVDVLVPVGYLSTIAISRHKKELLPFARIPVAEYEPMQVACNKQKTMQFASTLDVPIPGEYMSVEDITEFPVVAKDPYGSGKIRYIDSPQGFERLDLTGYLLQEYIPGAGYGFFALFNHGKVRAYFMHRRKREFPVTGGPSTCAESIYDENVKRIGLKLLESLQWHGVAMVEFKKDDRDGVFKLMEINPKFWGSLDLSIASGVNFPVLLANMALNGDIEPVFRYDTGITFRWPFPEDTVHLCAHPASGIDIIRECFDARSRTNLCLDDPLPNMVQIPRTCSRLARLVGSGGLRYPHGRPGTKR